MIQYIENNNHSPYSGFRPGDSVRAMIEGPVYPEGGEKWGIITWEGFCKNEDVAKTHRFYSHAEKAYEGYVWSDMVKMDSISIEKLKTEVDIILDRSSYEAASHCRDCCCARCWKALGITEYTGKGIEEHIADLKKELAYVKDIAYAQREIIFQLNKADIVALLQEIDGVLLNDVNIDWYYRSPLQRKIGSFIQGIDLIDTEIDAK